MRTCSMLLIFTALFMVGCQRTDEITSDYDEQATWDGSAALSFDTSTQPFIISTPAQLKLLSDIVNGTSTNPPAGATDSSSYVLSKSLNMNMLEWTPIGSVEKPFKGIFDGAKHTIKGLFINSTTGVQGLFGCMEGGIVKNIQTLDFDITAGDYTMNLDNNGSIVGYNKGGTVDACLFYGTFTNNGNAGGGIVGRSEGVDARIVNCQNLGTIIANSGCRVGGIVGYNRMGLVENCHNTASINGASYYLGGILGQNYHGNVRNCNNTGDISGTLLIGGVVGFNMAASVSNCSNTGNLNGYSDPIFDEAYGRVMGGVAGENAGTLTNCFNAGTIRTPALEEGVGIGGVVGLNSGTIAYCYYLTGCAKDGMAGPTDFQNGIGSDTISTTVSDIDGSTNAFTEIQGKSTHGKTGAGIGSTGHSMHAALVDCLNAWQSNNQSGNLSWTLTASKTGYPVLMP